MRRTILAAAAVAAMAVVPASQASQPVEGCQAVNVGVPEIDNSFSACNYLSTDRGGIVGVGSWKVVVHWSGDCGDEVTHGDNGWIRTSEDDNNIEGVAGAWAGSVNDKDYCVQAFALAPGSVVSVGNVGPIGQDDIG